MQKKALYWQIPLTIALFVVSLLFAAQLRPSVSEQNTLGQQSFESLSTLMVSQSEKRDVLYSEYAALFDELTEMQEAQASGRSMLAALMRQRNNLQIITGDIAVQGSGILISIPKNDKMMKYDLIDIVNELYLSGASIVSINDIRIGLDTKFGEKFGIIGNTTLTINNIELEYPLQILALGSPDTLIKGLSYTGGIISNLNLLYEVYPEITENEAIVISK